MEKCICEMEDRVISALQTLGYNESCYTKVKIKDMVNSSAIDLPFTQLIVWLANQLKGYCSLQETITGDPGSFLLEVKGFVRELGFAYGDILKKHGLESATGKLFLLDFLVTELQACEILSSSDDNKFQGAEKMEVEYNEAAKCMDQITTTLDALVTPNIQSLFENISWKLKEKLATLPDNYLDEPLLSKCLSSKQWETVSEINDAMCQEYKVRRQVLIKRVDVTIQSFTWSEKLKKCPEEVTKVYQPIRSLLIADSLTSVKDILAARKDLCIIEKTSSGEVREGTACAIQKVKIGKVPDRGGRPSSVAPPQEMPKFQQRKPDPPRGGGRGGGRGGYKDRGGGYGGGGGYDGRKDIYKDGQDGGSSENRDKRRDSGYDGGGERQGGRGGGWRDRGKGDRKGSFRGGGQQKDQKVYYS